ncbi:MAG: hypothetical protein FIB06_00680 [Betaproteobacteria bacterium]|nr:hypothetical protein [Betaproteobacteria bacterium]
MATSTERMRRHRAKLKVESAILEALRLGVDPAVLLADVRITLKCAVDAGIGRNVDRGHALKVA